MSAYILSNVEFISFAINRTRLISVPSVRIKLGHLAKYNNKLEIE